MIDPADALEVQVAKQAKIIDALIERSNQQHEFGGSAYSLFQSAVRLQSKISEKTRDLEDALTTLGRASDQLETSEVERLQTRRDLSDALEAMEGGFALFTGGALRVFNDFFRRLIPDVTRIVAPGLTLSAYVDAVAASAAIRPRRDADRAALGRSVLRKDEKLAAPFVFALKNDRWFVLTYRRARAENVIILLTEITAVVRGDRLEKTRLLTAQEDFLRAAFDNMPQGVATFSAEGALLIANDRFGDMLTLPPTLTAVGAAFSHVIEFLQTRALVDDPPRGDFPTLIRFLRRSGNLRRRLRHVNDRILDIDMHPLPGGGCIVHVMDVTAESQTKEMLESRVRERTTALTEVNQRLREQHERQARVEDDLRVAKAEVEAAMSSKTRFFAAASHDLLQPINAAKLMISTLVDQAAGTPMEETADRLNGSFRSIEGLLRALLDVSRLEATDTDLLVTSFSLGDVIRGVVEDLAPLAAAKKLDLRAVPTSLWVRSDQRYLARSLQNFVDNAIQYTDRGGILIGCRRRGDNAALEVWDTGIGISPQDQKRIFKEFTRVNGAGSSGYGVGLGLSIVERACRHLGHEISVRSKPGAGSVFSITLPVAPPAERPAGGAAPGAARRAEAEMDLIVLLIENDPGVAYAMTQKLESWGASVLATDSTEDAIALVRAIGVPPDIILADYQLTGDDNGIRTIMSVRRMLARDVPAIMITANHEDSIKEAGLMNRFSVLTKPVNLSRLRSLIDWKTRSTGAQG